MEWIRLGPAPISRMRIRSERQAQLLLLFGRHQLQNYQLTAGDQELFNHFRDALRSRNLVDYNDLISLTSGLLRECPVLE